MQPEAGSEAGALVPTSPPDRRKRALQLFTWFYLAPLTLLFVVLVCALLPLGSVLLVFVYGLPLPHYGK